MSQEFRSRSRACWRGHDLLSSRLVDPVLDPSLGAGLALAVWASRFVATLRYGLEPGDPVTLLASTATLGVIGALAGWLPANRASRVDPTELLHDA